MNSIKDAHLAYNYVRELVIKDVKNSKLWNLFNIMITDSDDTRCVKVVSVLKVWIYIYFFANTKRLIPKIFYTYSGPENQAKIANPIPILTLIRPKNCLIFELSLPMITNLALGGVHKLRLQDLSFLTTYSPPLTFSMV